MAKLFPNKLKLSPQGNNWQYVEFTLHNEFVNTPTTVNLFDINSPTPIPTTPSSAAPTVVANIPVVSKPTGIAYNSSSNRMYVCCRNNFPFNPNVSVIDCATNAVIATIIILGDPVYIAYDSINDRMYVTSISNDKVFVINCSTNTVITSMLVGNTPQGIAYDSTNGRMYVCNSADDDISVIDCSTNTVVSTISVGTTPEGIAYDVANNRMYVTNNTSNDVSVINCSTNTVISTIAVGTQPSGIAYNSNNNTMYVGHLGSDNVYIIACSANSVIGSPIALSGHNSVGGIAYNALTNIMYVMNDGASIDIIDCSTNTIIYTILTGGAYLGIAYNSSNDSAYFTGNASNDVSVLDSVQRFYITGTWDYNQYVRDLSINPKLVRQIVFFATNNQLARPIQLTYKDLFGVTSNTPRYPNLNISPYMPQRVISEMDFDWKNMELTFDANNYISRYTVAANSSMVLLIYYKELILSDALDINGKLLSCEKLLLRNCSENNVAATEEELEVFGEPIITMEETLKLNI